MTARRRPPPPRRRREGLVTAVVFVLLIHLGATTTAWLDPLGAEALRAGWRAALGSLATPLPILALAPLALPAGRWRTSATLALAFGLLLAGALGIGGQVGEALAAGVRTVAGGEGLLALLYLLATALVWRSGLAAVLGRLAALGRVRMAALWRSRPRSPQARRPRPAKRASAPAPQPPAPPADPARSAKRRPAASAAASPRREPAMAEYRLPTTLLKRAERSPAEPRAELERLGEDVRQTLREVTGVDPRLVDIAVGRSVIRLEFEVPSSSPLGRIRGAAENIALTTASVGKVRVVAPVPGRGTVAVEIPRRTVSTLRLREALESPEAAANPDSPLSFIMGSKVDGTLLTVDLAKLPHMLIAGATQSGKSVFINTLLLNLIYRNPPSRLKLILIDMKRVELAFYRDIPHLLVPIVTTTDAALNALEWACREVDRRYAKLEEVGAKDLFEHNRKAAVPMPWVVIVIDELSPLLDHGRGRVLESLSDLSERARAAGLHIVASMQRPDARKLDGSIKANLPGKVSFRLGTRADSTTIFGRGGAEDLLGRGDLYFDSPQFGDLIRCQAPLVETEEIEAVLDYLREHYGSASYDPGVQEELTVAATVGHDPLEGVSPGDRELLDRIRDGMAGEEAISVSQLQRQYGIGYNKAARLMMLMERLGWVAKDAAAAAGKKSWSVRV
ncbi:DNA translocase FtsK [bacterium]|nr:DNA translocase FtsK [bacterium]